MRSYPLMTELPTSSSTAGWSWRKISRSGHASDGFWIGTDADGNNWITKLRLSFYAYREIAFAKLVQGLNWSCQSSMYIQLDKDGASILGRLEGEVHAAHWYMDEHKNSSCGFECEFNPLFGREIRTLEDLDVPGIKHLIDWPKSEFAAYIFGANEPPGRLFTSTHEFVIIDSELMFSTGPCTFETATWLTREDGLVSSSGHALAKEVCSEIGSLSTESIERALALPAELQIELRWPIAANLRASIQFAQSYANRGAGA